jgi:hypothetical protein
MRQTQFLLFENLSSCQGQAGWRTVKLCGAVERDGRVAGLGSPCAGHLREAVAMTAVIAVSGHSLAFKPEAKLEE